MGSEGDPSWENRLVSTMGQSATTESGCFVRQRHSARELLPAPVPRSYRSGSGPVFNPTDWSFSVLYSLQSRSLPHL